MSAALQLNRIVQLVAEGSRLPEGAELPIADLARRFGVSAAQIQEDVRVLTLLGEHADADWLLSLEVWQEQDRVRVASRGPWQRPLRLTPDELAALRVALAADPDARVLVQRLNAILTEDEPPVAIGVPAADTGLLDDVRRAVEEHARLEVLYAGEGRRAAQARRIQPHQLVAYHGRWYCVAWCESAGAWRHFRVDRMVRVERRGEPFPPRTDFTAVRDAAGVFPADAESLDDVRVRFSPEVARWVKESYPRHETVAGGGGAVDVVLRAASPAWLARHVLRYGAAAEVIEPAAYREAVRRVVADAA